MFVGWEAGSALPNSNMVSYLWVASLWLFDSWLWVYRLFQVMFSRAQHEPPYSHLNHHDAGHLPDHLLLIGLGRNQPGLKQRLIPQS